MNRRRARWHGPVQAVLFLLAAGFGIPALLDWETFNGLDLVALGCALGFVAACLDETK